MGRSLFLSLRSLSVMSLWLSWSEVVVRPKVPLQKPYFANKKRGSSNSSVRERKVVKEEKDKE